MVECSTMLLWPLFTLIILGIALFFNYTAATGLVSDKDVGEVSDEYSLEITPASWTFSIWAFIYIWQALWICYVLYLTLKYKMNQIVFGKWFYITYNVGNICNALWIIIWVNEYVIPAALLLILIASFLITSAYIAHKYIFIDTNKTITNEQNQGDNYGALAPSDDNDITPKWLSNSKSIKPLIYILVLNGIPFYATWCVVATHLNIGISLCYKGGMTNTAASFLMLSILTCVILFYWFLDFYRLRDYLQYTYSPYIVLIVAFCGILTNGGLDADERPSSVFTLILLIIAILGSIAKVIMGLSMRNKPNQIQSV